MFRALAIVFIGASVALGVHAQDPSKMKLGKIRSLDSGVWVETTVVGKGAKPRADSVVKVHYRGTLDNGKEFDSSYSRGTPAILALNGVIACWSQGIPTMAVGGKATLTCPASTAYGERGAGEGVPANARLTFEVELLDILK